ncbi:MAG: hypothetical protein AB7E73_02140, partial [Burkholderiales bacterium]
MISSILKTKLKAIDADCECAVAPEIDNLYAAARYDGSRFCAPSFQSAGTLWLDLIKKKEREFVKEISRVLGTPGAVLSAEGIAEMKCFINAIFSDDRYVERMRIFSEGVGRKAASYGLIFDAAAHRVDIPESAYRVGAMNALSKARVNVCAEIDLLSHSKTPDSVRALSQWLLYLHAHPWRSLSTL